METNRLNINLYNPGKKEKETLKREFVVRTKIFDVIFNDIKSSQMEHTEQAYLLIGQRGSGKTTLLQRIRYAVEDDKGLNKFLIPIVFTEEQYNINELTDMWETIAAVLEDYHGFQSLTSSISEVISNNEYYEEKAFKVLIEALNKKEKKIIVLIDNIGEVFKKLDNLEIKRFREILTTVSQMRIIGANTSLSEHIFDYREPFHEFFNVIMLNDLSGDEIKTLLNKIAAVNHQEELIKDIIENEPHRIDILRNLTGGVPRTIIMMFNVFVDNVDGKSVRDLELMLDNVTPLYKARLDDLSAQQQKIVDAVAKNWDSVSVKDIVEKTRLESKLISAQLNQLVRDNFIESIETEGKNKVYRIKERFLNIWYLMRYGRRHDQSRVIWLVKFMEALLTKDELHKKAQEQISQLQLGGFDAESAAMMSEALLACEHIDGEVKWNLLEMARKNMPLPYTEYMRLGVDEYCMLVATKLAQGKIEDAEHIYSEIPHIALGKEILWAAILYEKKDYEEFKQITVAILNDDRTPTEIKRLAYYMLGVYYGSKTKQHRKAIEYLIKSNAIKEDKETYKFLAGQYGYLKDETNAKLSSERFEALGGSAQEAKMLYAVAGLINDAVKLYEGDATLKKHPEKLVLNIFDKILTPEMRTELGPLFPFAVTAMAQVKMKGNKLTAYENYQKARKLFLDKPSAYEAMILLWNGYYEESLAAIRRYFNHLTLEKVERKNTVEEINDYFVMLIAKQSTETAHKLFQDFPFLKDKVKPTWFALIFHSGDNYKMEFLKMAPELTEPVSEVLKQIERAKIDYA